MFLARVDVHRLPVTDSSRFRIGAERLPLPTTITQIQRLRIKASFVKHPEANLRERRNVSPPTSMQRRIPQRLFRLQYRTPSRSRESRGNTFSNEYVGRF